MTDIHYSKFRFLCFHLKPFFYFKIYQFIMDIRHTAESIRPNLFVATCMIPEKVYGLK